MSRVFVVQQPAFYDRAANGGKGGFVAKYDLSPATKHGELVFLLGPGNIFKDRLVKARETLSQKLADFTENDFLLAVGDPVAIALAVMYAAAKTGGKINFLKWDRIADMYEPFIIKTA